MSNPRSTYALKDSVDSAEHRRGSASTDVLRIKHLLSTDAPAEDIERQMNGLSDGALRPFGLDAFRINLTALFGRVWPIEKIHRVAREALINKLYRGWEYHARYLAKLGPDPDVQRVENLPIDLIASARASGRGIILVSFHQGQMRYPPSDFAHAGIPICIPLATDAFNEYRASQESNPEAYLWRFLKYVNVENPAGALTLARSIAKGMVVCCTLDGNTGIDGPRGGDRRLELPFFSTRVQVKDGLIRMAARFGCMILPAAAHLREERRICEHGALIDPLGPLEGEAADAFVHSALSEIYAYFARDLESHPSEWCGAGLFHQWRLPDPPEDAPSEDAERRLSATLSAGGSAAVNFQRIVELTRRSDIVLTDAKTMRSYRLPLEFSPMVDRLFAQETGVHDAWLAQQGPELRRKMMNLMAALYARDALILRAMG